MKKYLLLSLTALLFCACKSADGFRFEKLVYHTSPCFGACPHYHMEITADKKIRLHNEMVMSKRMGTADNTKAGYFKGEATQANYDKLIQQLRTVGLDTLQFKGPMCCDAPMQTVIVYYNGKRKYLKAMFPPEHAHALLASIRDIYQQDNFGRVSETFVLESDSLAK